MMRAQWLSVTGCRATTRLLAECIADQIQRWVSSKTSVCPANKGTAATRGRRHHGAVRSAQETCREIVAKLLQGRGPLQGPTDCGWARRWR